jgi:hypothetical protein
MLEVANSEHALFSVLSQSYSFRCFTADNDSTFGLFNISSRKYIPVVKTKAPQTRLSHEALVEQPPRRKAVFSASASVIACPPMDLVFSLLPNPVLGMSMPAQVKWQLE